MTGKLYDELAGWWPLVSAPADYAEEAGHYAAMLRAACDPRRVLELGSGGGNNASHLSRHFEMTLADRSAAMLDVSRALNPGCEHVEADMRTLRLGRRFDAVFMHDALSYLTTPDDLAAALATAHAHCRPGGAALLVPDHFRETFRPGATAGGHDGPDRSLRFLEWRFDPDPADTTVTVDYAFLLRRGRGDVSLAHDRHLLGIFERDLWLRACRAAGFQPKLRPLRLTTPEPLELETILCRRAG